jgi:uncharacterized membrane protein (UPF0127 family)
MRPRPVAPAVAGWRIAAAATRAARTRGLLGCAGLGPRDALWLPVRSVHTIGMRFALDLVWLRADGGVARLDPAVRAGRVRTCAAARGGVLEVAAGRGPALVAALAARAGSAEARRRAHSSASPGSSSSARVRDPR